MLFHSSLRKELSRAFGATLVVLSTVVVTMILIRMLGLAAKGSVNPSEVLLVMSYTALGYMPSILSLSLFTAIVGTLTRMYRDSEMVIWFSAGRGLTAFVKPLVSFSWPVLALIAVLSLVAWPWANSQTQSMRENYARRGDIERVAPGEFQESAGRYRVFFIDKDTANGTTASNIFIASMERNLQIVTSARTGRIETQNGDRYLMLKNGQRLERSLVDSKLKISEFNVYGALLGGKASAVSNEGSPRTRPTLTLLRDPTNFNLGQLGWRLGILLAAVNLVLFALCVANVNPRVGQSGNLLLALFAFVIYYNLLNLAENWVSSGRFSLGGCLLVLHGGMLILSVLWLAKRHNNWNWTRWRPIRRNI